MTTARRTRAVAIGIFSLSAAAIGEAQSAIASVPASESPLATSRMPLATSQSGYVAARGLRMYYEIHGEGPPLVLIHGTTATIQSSFGAIIPLLARTHRVIGLEMQAHGHTADIDRPLSFEGMADDVDAALEQLHVARAEVVGWSMGGNVALELAIRHPARVKGLILSGTTYALGGMQQPVIDGIRNATPATVPAEFHAEYARVAPDPSAWPRHIAKVRELWLSWQGIPLEAIRGIGVPALVLAGDADAVRAEHTLALFNLFQRSQVARFKPGDAAAAMSSSELAILPGTSHATFQDRPVLVAELIEQFLSRGMSPTNAERRH